MVKFLWAFLLLSLGLVWLKMTNSPWLYANIILHVNQNEVKTSLWIVLVGVFCLLVITYTILWLWFGLASRLRGGKGAKAMKTQAAWEDVTSKLFLGEWVKALHGCQKLIKNKDKSASLGQILAAWLRGVLYESSEDDLSEKYFDSKDWLKIQAPRAMQLQWLGKFDEANILWCQIFQRDPSSVVFLKLWLQGLMYTNASGEALAGVAGVFDKHRGVVFKHYPEFGCQAQMYLFLNHAYQDQERLIQTWQTVARFARRQATMQHAYVKALIACEALTEAKKILEQEIPKNWDSALCQCYAQLVQPEEQQIKILSRWLKYAPKECHLHLYQGLAYAYARSGLWDQTRQMLENVKDDLVGQTLWSELLALTYIQLHQFGSANEYLFNHLPLAGLKMNED